MNLTIQKTDFSNPIEKNRFDEVVARSKNTFVQQTTWWAEMVKDVSGDEPVYLYSENPSITASMYLFHGAYGKILVSNIQPGTHGTFACPVQEMALRRQAYREMLETLVRTAREAECMSITVTSNPLDPDEDLLIREFLEPETGMSTFIQAIPLDEFFSSTGEVLIRNYHKRSCLSRNLKKAAQCPFRFRESRTPDDLKQWYDRIHCPRIRALGGSPVPWKIFENIAPHLGDGKATFFTVTETGSMVAGVLCIHRPKGVVDNYMMSALDEASHRGVNYFLVDRLLRWCVDNDFSIYNWQSSNPPEGGIFRFKKQWGSRVYPYAFQTKIIDRRQFSLLQQQNLRDIIHAYRGHFVAPYPTLTGKRQRNFTKTETNLELRFRSTV